VRCYLRRRDPLREPPPPAADLAEHKWLSFVWNHPAEPPGALGGDTVWPHAVGELALNPVYAITAVHGAEVQVHFEFPSIHFCYENHGMLAYHPLAVNVTHAQLAALTQPSAARELADLVASFVLLGTPSRYLPALPAALTVRGRAG